MVTVGYEPLGGSGAETDTGSLPQFTMAKSRLKGALVSRLTDSPLTIVNAHPIANDDWDWSPTNSFNSLQQAQLETLASVITNQNGNVVLGTDLNVAKTSGLFKDFLSKCALNDVFASSNTPTFANEFMAKGLRPECIDFVLCTVGVAANKAQLIAPNTANDRFLTDHFGLVATLSY